MIEMLKNNKISFLLKLDTQGIEEMLKYIKTVSKKKRRNYSNTLFRAEKGIYNKICITEKTNSGFAGIDIERIGRVINYTVWFNQKKYDISSKYYNLINDFLLFIKQEIKNKLVLCAIGKEVIFDFQNDYTRLFKTSHNIDIIL